MTVEEVKPPLGEANGHGGKDQFPVGMRVLAVDDDPTCLKVLERLLLRCQYHVTTTGQAATALKLLRENKDQFDLVISDVQMPDMDGFKLLELVGLEMDLPVIMLSENGETRTVMKGITHGACDYLLKPVRLEQLRTIWQHVVRRRSCDAKNHGNENDDVGKKARIAEGENGGANRNKRTSHKDRDDNGDDGDDSDENSNENGDSSTQKKARVVWSVELHRKFVSAVNQLGIDKAVPKKILDLMNVGNITRENVASHLQKYRLYLKRLSADASRQANLTAAFGGRNPAYINMGLEAFKHYNAYGRYCPIPTTSHSQPNNLLARMNSPSAFGMHGLLPSQPLQIGYTQNNLSTSLGNVGGMSNGNLISGANMSLQDSSKCFPTRPSGNNFANISNATPLAPANSFSLQDSNKCFPTRPSGNNSANISNATPLPPANSLSLQSLEPSNQQHLGRMHSSSADPFNSFVGESPQFPDIGRCNTTWPTAVSSSIQELGQKGSMPQATLHVNASKVEPHTSFAEPTSQIPLLRNEMQTQVTSLASNDHPMPFNQDAVPFTYGSSTNSREMLNNNIAFSNPGIHASLPNLRIDNSIVPRQTMDVGNAGGVPPLQDGRIHQHAACNQLNYNNELMGTSRLQRGPSGGLDDIVVDMFRPEHTEDGIPFIEADWELL